jgi:hypothetical protein
MTFSYTRFPVNKINVEKIFKIMRKLLFNYSFYSHPEIGIFLSEYRGATPPGKIIKIEQKRVTRKDLQPAQPVVRQQGGLTKIKKLQR